MSQLVHRISPAGGRPGAADHAASVLNTSVAIAAAPAAHSERRRRIVPGSATKLSRPYQSIPAAAQDSAASSSSGPSSRLNTPSTTSSTTATSHARRRRRHSE